jgi:hypothetical protein
MAFITRKNIENLIQVQEENCLTFIVPTERVGENAESMIMLKNQVSDMEKRLSEKGKKPREINSYLAPVKNLIDESGFWRNLSDSLFIYRKEDKLHVYTLPVKTEKFSLLSDRFYILPVLSVLYENDRFFLLLLSMNQNRLFDCDLNSFEEIEAGDIMPDTIIDVIGSDVEQKSLQYRSGQTGIGTSMYHGKGEGKDDKKLELTKYLQKVDKGLNTLLQGYTIPLVISSVDYVFSSFRDLSTYSNVYPENISGNYDELASRELYNRACEVLRPYFDENRKLIKHSYEEKNNKASSDLEKIIAAAHAGQVESLFIKENNRVWGEYDEENMKTIIHKSREDQDHCLLDLAARKTFATGGKVFIEKADSMPEPGKKINAILRYS